jgi:HSP20 family protein
MTLHKKRRRNNLFPSVFDNFFENRMLTPSMYGFNSDMWDNGISSPPANISETKDEFRIDLSAPGLTREDLKVDVDNGILSISCEKEEETNDEKDEYKRREFSYSSFTRSFQLPENAMEEKIVAKYENGMLKISIPKKEKNISASKKSIEIA